MSVRILTGDCREVLKTLPDESAHCVVTSPPYWGLRDCGNENGLGLEPTLAEHIENMVGVFREVRRVLRKDGTLWLNYGDCYATSGGSGVQGSNGQRASRAFTAEGSSAKGVPAGLKPKDLVMLPARIALALQADGWWLRSEIVWAKPNPMPESVTDRPTSAHEKIYLLTKSPRYFYDAEAVRMPVNPNNTGKCSVVERQGGTAFDESGKPSGAVRQYDEIKGANCRNVWTIATAPFSEAHFATFPPGLIEPCIKAGCPKGGVVLDPFGGAGTTGLVADRLGRDAILIELNPDYVAMARKRIADDAGMFGEIAAQ